MFGPEIRNKPDQPDLIEPAREAYAMLSDAVAVRLSKKDAGPVDPAIATLAAWSIVHGLATLLVDRQINPNMTGGAEVDAETLSAGILSLFAGELSSRPD